MNLATEIHENMSIQFPTEAQIAHALSTFPCLTHTLVQNITWKIYRRSAERSYTTNLVHCEYTIELFYDVFTPFFSKKFFAVSMVYVAYPAEQTKEKTTAQVITAIAENKCFENLTRSLRNDIFRYITSLNDMIQSCVEATNMLNLESDNVASSE